MTGRSDRICKEEAEGKEELKKKHHSPRDLHGGINKAVEVPQDLEVPGYPESV